MAEHSILSGLDLSTKAYTDNSVTTQETVGTVFYVRGGVAGWTCTGVRMWISAAMAAARDLSGAYAYLYECDMVSTTALKASKGPFTLVAGWNDLRFDTPVALTQFPSGKMYVGAVRLAHNGWSFKNKVFDPLNSLGVANASGDVIASDTNLVGASGADANGSGKIEGNGVFYEGITDPTSPPASIAGLGGTGGTTGWGSFNSTHYGVDVLVTDPSDSGGTAPSSTTAPHITPTSASTGGVLSCSDGTWSGTPTPTLTKQWTRDGANISGATGGTYTLVVADEGHVIGCRVTATNTAGSASAVADDTVTPTAPPPGAPVNSVLPAITTDGTPQTGESVSCSTGSWTNTPTGYAYQWTRDGTNISGATVAAYALQVADEGHAVRCRVTATNGVGSASATSASITPQGATPQPVVSQGAQLAIGVGGQWVGLKLAANVDGNEFAFDDYDDGVDSAAAFRAMVADGVQRATDRETFHSRFLFSARNHVFDSAPVKVGPSYGWGIIPPFPDTGMKYKLAFEAPGCDTGDWNHWEQLVPQRAGCTIECPYTTTTPDLTYQSTPAIVCGPMQPTMFPAVGITSGYSNCLVSWRGIQIVAPYNAGTIGLHLFRCAQAYVADFGYHVEQTRAFMASHPPTNDQTIALMLPVVNNNDYARVGSVGVYGAYWGMNVVDHLAMTRGGFIFCKKALFLPGVGGGHYHGAFIGNLSVEAGETVLDASGASAGGRFPLFIAMCNTELQSGVDFIDPQNALRGLVYFSEDTDKAPTKTGATGLTVTNLYAA